MLTAEELRQVSDSQTQSAQPVPWIQFQVQYKAPEKIKPAMVVYADGTTWNPGAGEGLYVRSIAGTWVKVS